jgi:Riboflavin synthase alpha chain
VIPHTWRTTALHHLRVGDRVNLEVDVIARYTERLLATEPSHADGSQVISAEWLARQGWS